MNILLVGAGAVGQAYGRHLQLGGARISFMVREKYAGACRAGLTLYPLNRPKATRWQPVPFAGFGVLTRTDEVATDTWDQVWLCISSPALQGPWLDAFLKAIGNTTLVFLQPGLRDRDVILERWPAERLVHGLITLISYQAPLPGERVPHPGVAYLFPPLTATPFTGPPDRTQAVVNALRAGGCRAKVSPHVRKQAALASAMLMPHVVALETAGWSLPTLHTSPLLTLAARASHEAMMIAATYTGFPPPAVRHVVQPLLTRLVLRLVPRVPAENTPLVKGTPDVAVASRARSSGASVPHVPLALARRGGLCRGPLRPLLGAWESPPLGGREPPRPAAAPGLAPLALQG